MYPDYHSLPLRPDDLALLQNILDEELEARHVPMDSEQAEELARRLVDLFQSGVRSADNIRKVMRPDGGLVITRKDER
ncbi:hypothetical protein SAMCCGM7_pC0344 (plasmid) [Sinorhizobium americanum CCGM7]|uniref:hypothetical protein n=1 Tax=Sinorhizobium americanum TaxID=194963 RepID=UPI0004D61913|nr:hypothetical protein [Sinorhizobium americanum]APG87546.1 hypothetical protein SAMCCGM7_pC0344 [Sinorhizobium americanum CCGM7]